MFRVSTVFHLESLIIVPHNWQMNTKQKLLQVSVVFDALNTPAHLKSLGHSFNLTILKVETKASQLSHFFTFKG